MKTDEPNACMDNNETLILTEGILKWDNYNALLFVAAHEVSHRDLKHLSKQQFASYAITGVMVAAGYVIPGIGLLNHVVNPAIVNNYSKIQEFDADKNASHLLVRCFHIPIDEQIKSLQYMQAKMQDGGKFWDRHPSWNDRIKNIQEVNLPPLSQPSARILGTIQP
jgi:Zn-dependent protease with chaperone function